MRFARVAMGRYRNPDASFGVPEARQPRERYDDPKGMMPAPMLAAPNASFTPNTGVPNKGGSREFRWNGPQTAVLTRMGPLGQG